VKLHGTAFGADGVRLERTLPGPVDRVWDYLVDSRKRATWLAGGEIEPRVGGKVNFVFDNDALSAGAPAPDKYRDVECNVSGRVTRFEPPHALAMTWSSGRDHSEVSFELTPRGEEVLLVITHRRLTDRNERIGVAGGWETHVGILADRLRGTPPQPFWPTHAAFEREYDAKL
jgi:uncharacterized protein YndB with AHSA1/START domain